MHKIWEISFHVHYNVEKSQKKKKRSGCASGVGVPRYVYLLMMVFNCYCLPWELQSR